MYRKAYKPLGVLAAIAIASSTGAISTPTRAQTPIKIGVAVAQTSNTALLGQEQVVGAKIAEKYFNDKGGVNGTPIQLIFQDTAGDEAGAINAFTTSINTDQVVGILGPTLSQQAFASDPIADQAGVPVIAPSNTAKGIPQIGKYIFRVSAPVAIVAPNAIREALKINPDIKKVARFFAQDDAFSKSETGTFETTLKELGLEEVTVQTFSTKDTDFTAQVTNALALSPDLAIISGLASDGGNLVVQLRDLGFTGLIIGGNGLNTANIFPVCKASCDGMLIAQAYSYNLDSPVNNDFRERYKAEQNKEPPQFSAQAFAGIQVFVEALTALDKTTPIVGMDLAALRTALRDQLFKGSYDTPLGTISFVVAIADDGSEKGGELVQATFYVAQIDMNDDGQTGVFNLIASYGAEDTAASTMEATMSADSTMMATMEATAAQ